VIADEKQSSVGSGPLSVNHSTVGRPRVRPGELALHESRSGCCRNVVARGTGGVDACLNSVIIAVHASHLSTVTTSQRLGTIGLDSPIEAPQMESLTAQEVWNSRHRAPTSRGGRAQGFFRCRVGSSQYCIVPTPESRSGSKGARGCQFSEE
jgi:hypothetical protein